MKKIINFLTKRTIVVSLCILLQFAFVYLGVYWLSAQFRWLELIITLLSWSTTLFILSRNVNPSYKIAWILPILALPVFGIVLYALFGGNRLSARLKRKMAFVQRTLRSNLIPDEEVSRQLAREDADAAVQSQYLLAADFPVYRNTQTVYFPSGESCFERMKQELSKAEKTIFLEYFIISPGVMFDPIIDILREKIAQGVDVRLIYDDFGCIEKLPRGYDKLLRSYGIRVCVFNPYVPVLSSRLNNRDHRKLMLIDGKVGFTGGINLNDEYINRRDRGCGHWKDCGLMLRGEAVWSLTVMFLSMWNYISGEKEQVFAPVKLTEPAASGYVQPFADSPLDNETITRTVYMNLINKAKRRVYIMTPYLIIDDSLIETLSIAAKSGVDVRIITPSMGDKDYVHLMTRAYYIPLVEAGVRIFEYQPGFIHSKVFLTDDSLAVVGTVNLDFRSLYLHFENGVWLYDADCIAQIHDDFEETFLQCREVSYQDCMTTPWYLRLARSILRIFSPLM